MIGDGRERTIQVVRQGFIHEYAWFETWFLPYSAGRQVRSLTWTNGLGSPLAWNWDPENLIFGLWPKDWRWYYCLRNHDTKKILYQRALRKRTLTYYVYNMGIYYQATRTHDMHCSAAIASTVKYLTKVNVSPQSSWPFSVSTYRIRYGNNLKT